VRNLLKNYSPELPDVAFIDVGDFIGFTVRFASQKKIQRIILAGFIGKISKNRKRGRIHSR